MVDPGFKFLRIFKIKKSLLQRNHLLVLAVVLRDDYSDVHVLILKFKVTFWRILFSLRLSLSTSTGTPMLRPYRCLQTASSCRLIQRSFHVLCKPSAFRKHASPRHPWRSQNRGAKRSSTANLLDIELPQGVIPLDPLPLEESTQTLPTVLQQAKNNIRKFENCVLLTRVGGFYELYFEHADEFGPLLNLKVAQRKVGKAPHNSYVSMVCIFPILFH